MIARRVFHTGRTAAIAAIIGALGAVGIAIGFAVAPDRAFAAYFAAWAAVATTVFGGVLFLAITYAANARWPAAVRRVTEAVAGGVIPVAVLAAPLAVAPARVWPWVEPSPQIARAAAVESGYLSLPWFAVRAVAILAVFAITAELLIAWSRRRDDSPAAPVHRPAVALDRERTLASAMLPVLGLATTLAGIDWLMSLQPAWWSSGFGLYVVTGCLRAGVAIIAVLAWRGVAIGTLPLRPGHFHALGRLLHAFVILWAYIAFFQAMLIQIADKPSEVTFYVDRLAGGWRAVTVALVVIAFAIPFLLLFWREGKHRARYTGAIAAVVLVGHYLDLWWLVVPHADATAIPSWTDASAIAAVVGLVTAGCAWRMRGVPVVPVGDPYLADGLAYRTDT